MANFSIKTDLLKLKGSFLTNLKGKTATKRNTDSIQVHELWEVNDYSEIMDINIIKTKI